MIDAGLKEQLMSALQDGVSRVNRGTSPNQALAKAAEDADFNVEQTRRLCELFNTARTLHHFEKNKDCKEASFDLAESNIVLGIMFDAPECAEKLAADFYDYSEYEHRDPASHSDLDDDLFGMAKAASEDYLDIEAQAGRAYRTYDTQMRMAGHLRDEARQAAGLAVDLFAKTAQDIRYAEDAGEHRYGLFLHLRPGAPARLDPHFSRPVEVTSTKYAHVVDSGLVKPWLDSFDRAENLMFKAASAESLADEVEKEARDFREQFEHIVSGDLLKRADDKKKDDKKDKEKKPDEDFFGEIDPFSLQWSAPFSSAARGATHGAGALIEGAGQFADPIVKGTQASIGDKLKELVSAAGQATALQRAIENSDSSAALDNTQREILLTEVMATDPYIRDADPEAVVAAYNNLLETAPGIALRRGAVIAYLRAALHSGDSGALDQYTAKGYQDLEKIDRQLAGKLPIDPKA